MPNHSENLSRDESWALEIATIPHELRKEEAELFRSKWFDYRHLLPAQATYLFTEKYEEIGREAYEQTRDYRVADTIRMLNHDDIFQSSEVLSMWKARQSADRIGCKYEFYLRQIFKRHLDRGFRFFPRPNQLASEEIELDVADAWEEEKRWSLQLAADKRFRNEFYTGHPDQVAYHAYLIEQIKQRAQQHMALGRVVFKERVLPLEIAGEHFGAEVVRRAYCLHSA